MIRKLDFYASKDMRIKRVYDYAKRKYDSTNSLHQSFSHVTRVLYRALDIADHEADVNYCILIPAAILHDIGVTIEGDEHHSLRGCKVAYDILKNFGYSEEETQRIISCIRKHGGINSPQIDRPETIEEKILWDADLLEKSGISGLFSSYAIFLESDEDLLTFSHRRAKGIENMKGEFYTERAKEMDDGGMKEVVDHFTRIVESSKKRKDWFISEQDLWDS